MYRSVEITSFRNMEVKSVVFLLLVSAATSLAQQKCCYPDQFEALDGQLVGTVQSGQGVAILEGVQFAFDYTNKRVGQFAYIEDESQTYTYQVIADYSKGVEYIIQAKTKTCQKVSIQGLNMTHCVPDGATYQSSFYVGDNKLTVDSFKYQLKEGPLTGNLVLEVSQGDCIPYGVTFIGTQGATPILTVAGFANYTSGIKDPAHYFTVPTYCSPTFSKEPKIYNTLLHKLFA